MQKCNFLEFQFWANLVQKVKIVSLILNLEPSLCRICMIQFVWFCFGLEIPFLEKFGLKIQNF